VKSTKILLWMVTILFAFHFAIQNDEEVTLRYALQHYQLFEISRIPLFMVILCSLLLGGLIAIFESICQRIQVKKTLRQNQKIIEKLEKEIEALRTLETRHTAFLKKEE
jgi:uncharacterized integral membrane protein